MATKHEQGSGQHGGKDPQHEGRADANREQQRKGKDAMKGSPAAGGHQDSNPQHKGGGEHQKNEKR